MCVSTIVGALIAAGPVLGAGEGVLFYAGFEGTIDAIGAGDGRGRPHEGAPQFRPGKRGLALLAGSGAGFVSYALKGNLNLEEGSVEFWVCPLNWNGKTKRFHVFFEAKRRGWFLIYAVAYYGAMFLVSDRTDVWSRVHMPIEHFRPGEWHHFVATWSKEEIRLYLDGKPSLEWRNPRMPRAVGERFLVGDRGWHTKQREQSLIDELYIYDRPLTPREVAWAYAHAVDRPRGRDVPLNVTPFVQWVRVRPFPSKREIRVEFALNKRHKFSSLTGEARLVPGAGTKPGRVQFIGKRRGFAVIEFAGFHKGEYAVELLLRDRQTGRRDRWVERFKYPGPAEWRGNCIGISQTPPPPWTPVRVRGPTVEVWNRLYKLGPLGLPTSIESGGIPLLAGPIELRCVVRERTVQWEPDAWAKPGASPARAEFGGFAHSAIGTLRWRCTAEFDGLLRYDLSLVPREGAVVDSLEIVFPLRKEQAPLCYLALDRKLNVERFEHPKWGAASSPVYPGDPLTIRGTTPRGKGVVFQRDGVIYWWFGNEERGLLAFCESDAAWAEVRTGRGFRIERRGDALLVVWAFAVRRWQLKGPWRFTFGIQATPVKPRRNWRRYRPVRVHKYASEVPEVVGANVAIWWTHLVVLRYHGYPEPTDPVRFRETVKRLHGRGLMVVPYLLLLGLDIKAPEAFYLEEWRNGRMGQSIPHNSILMGVYPNRDWTDFIVWKVSRFVRNFDLDGLYVDWTGVHPSVIGESGGGYVRKGRVRPTYPFFATRELYKRVYTMLKQYGRERGRETFMLVHASTRWLAPVLSFADAYVDGEQFWGMVKDNYLDVMPLEHVRTEFIGRNIGAIPFFLPELHSAEQQRALTPQLVGLALLHDFNLWPIYCDRKEVNRAYKALDAFGIQEAAFLPYWRNADVVRTQDERVRCSIYRRGDRALLCLVNLSRKALTARLTLNWERLLADGKPIVYDALSGKRVALEGDSLSVGIPPLGYRLLLVKAQIKREAK